MTILVGVTGNTKTNRIDGICGCCGADYGGDIKDIKHPYPRRGIHIYSGEAKDKDNLVTNIKTVQTKNGPIVVVVQKYWDKELAMEANGN